MFSRKLIDSQQLTNKTIEASKGVRNNMKTTTKHDITMSKHIHCLLLSLFKGNPCKTFLTEAPYLQPMISFNFFSNSSTKIKLLGTTYDENTYDLKWVPRFIETVIMCTRKCFYIIQGTLKCFRNQYHYNDIINYGITFMNTNQSYTNTYYDNNYCTDG